MRLALGLTFS